MDIQRFLRLKFEKLNKEEYPVAVAINDKYIVFARESLEIKDDQQE